MNDSTAQMGFQVGKTAVLAGQEYMEQNVCNLVYVYKYVHTDNGNHR
jgi:hypothetical protein